MVEVAPTAPSLTDVDWADQNWAEDPEVRARQIDALMAGPPADLPPIIVFGDDAVFGIHPARRGP